MSQQHTINLADLELVLMSAKLRRYTQCGTALLAACTPRPLIEIDCHRRIPRPSDLAFAASSRKLTSDVGPMDRGHIAELFERVRLQHGISEVRKTFGCGIRALRAESRWTLFGGRKGGAA